MSAPGVLPGYRLTLFLTVGYLGVAVVVPMAALIWRGSALAASEIADAVTGPRALAAFRLSFGAAALAAALNGVLGLLTAWALSRYRFPGRDFIDALVDLPFALPTAVAGIALTALYSENGLLGQRLAACGLKVAYTRLGVVLALIFVGFPFVVRALQPVLLGLDRSLEEAAAVLGAGRVRTFVSVVLPALLPALLSGMMLAFARALGEYGSVLFISGNLPLSTEIVPLLIASRLEQHDDAGATALAVVMLSASFALMLVMGQVRDLSLRRPVGDGRHA